MPENPGTQKALKKVETLVHDKATRRNIPTAELEALVQKEYQSPIRVAYERRNKDIDPQLVWRGKDEQDWSDLVVNAPPIYIQEKVHPKALIDDLIRQSKSEPQPAESQFDLFADFNGLPSQEARTEFYQHDGHWQNRMILGDSLQVMASLAERENLRGQVQCIYFDPPYGIKFNSNFQWSTTSRTVTDGKAEHITREPEQVKAFRDTWRDGLHSYLGYLRDRLTVARDLLTVTGSIFVQIGDENVHTVRAVLDEVFGAENCICLITFKKTSGAGSISGGTTVLPAIADYLLWYARDVRHAKYRQLFLDKEFGAEGSSQYRSLQLPNGSRRVMTASEVADPSTWPSGARPFGADNLTSPTGVDTTRYEVTFSGRVFRPHPAVWKTSRSGMERLSKADRLTAKGTGLYYVRFLADFPARPLTNLWNDTQPGSVFSGADERLYVVQTTRRVIQRCILMATDPGDLVLDPTCGSGTTAYVAEQWGRRWITIDTSRVALALARARIMGARYPYYLLTDSPEGQAKEAEVTRTLPSTLPTRGDIRHGFVYERVPHITLKSIANNAEIDVIWDTYQQILEPIRQTLNTALKQSWDEWQIPREADAKNWPPAALEAHAEWWENRIARQKKIDDSIAAKADYEYLYDKPYEAKNKVRVAGPFTVESLSPHRTLGVDENDNLIDPNAEPANNGGKGFVEMILENLRTAGVQQAHKEDKIAFTALTPWPGDHVCAEGRYIEESNGKPRRAAVFIGPEFGTVSRPDLVFAAREAAEAGFDVLISCAFNYDAHSSDLHKLGAVPILKARMNADLHMAEDLKNTGKGNLFVIFGEPDIELRPTASEPGKYQVKILGVDVFHPGTGEVRSDGPEGIACWFVDTDYNGQSFFVRHAYFLGANDPYKALKTTLKAEIDEDAWSTLNSDTSRPFEKPASGRIAVKVINHLGDEVMKVFKV